MAKWRVQGDYSVQLTDAEQAMLAGDAGAATATAMSIIVRMGELAGAERLIEVSGAHIDGCLYHGPVGLDFAELLARQGGRVRVPTTLNVSALDLLHPDRVLLDDATRARARRLMDAYVEMGCQPSWTCAPYQLPDRPAFGEHIAWAESNAIVFANSVLGARTDRYGDFIDICAALTGRVPLAGLHLDEARRATVVFRVAPEIVRAATAADRRDELAGLIGLIVGRRAGDQVPAIVGLPADTSEDELKALGAAAASSGAVGLCHVVGVTPEAGTLEAALGGGQPESEIDIDAQLLDRAWRELTTDSGSGPLVAVSVGTPHFSPAEFVTLDRLLDGRRTHPRVEVVVSTGRAVLERISADGLAGRLAAAGVSIVVDTCTYITPILRAEKGALVMTNSAKWAWYAPGNLGVQVAYGALTECVESAVEGRVVRVRPTYLDS